MEKRVEFEFLEINGRNEVIEFLEKLPKKDKDKLIELIEKVEYHGLEIAKRMEWTKKLENNLFELRSKLGSNIQRCLYFQKKNNQYIITHGFTKKDNKTPKKEIKHAKKLIEKYERTDKNG